MLKTLFRSEVLSLAWISFTGIGLIVAAQTVFAATAKPTVLEPLHSAALLGVPLALAYFLLLGLRLAFEILALLRANWIFRLAVDPATSQCGALAKRVMITFAAPLLIAFSADLLALLGLENRGGAHDRCIDDGAVADRNAFTGL